MERYESTILRELISGFGEICCAGFNDNFDGAGVCKPGISS